MKIYFYILAFSIFNSFICRASAPLILDDNHHSMLFKGIYLDYLEDASGKLTLQEITTKYKNSFIQGKPDEVINSSKVSSYYWTRLTIENKCTIRRNWVIELYDYKINYYEAYLPNDTGGFDIFTGGSLYPFNIKDYKHKNFIFDLYELKGGQKTIYFKIKATRRVVLIGVVRTIQRMLEYSNSEYFLLSIFYGIILAMIIYNLFLYISTFDIAYFFYVLYVTSIGLLALTKDGLGFQYFWENHPLWNDLVPTIASFSVVFWALLYARSFLNTHVNLPVLDKGILLLLSLRTIFFILSFYYPVFALNSWVDLIPLIYIYALGIISWALGYRMARFYILAFTLFFIGFSVSVMNDFQVISSHPLVIYGFNVGVLCEMLLLSLALADRIKILTIEKEIAQKEIIIQSQENDNLKDKINRELEDKVHERTIELEEKNKELDTFVYRSSHDIKGPLKSIIGLTTIGLSDVKDEVAKNYFEHILKSSKRLDSVVEHLLHIMETKESRIKISKIEFSIMISDIFSSFEHLPNFKEIKKEVKVDQQKKFLTDDKLLYSVIQNLIENAIKYSDCSKEKSYLKVDIKVAGDFVMLEISDNGLGIEKRLQEKIFDMFYKVNMESSGSGLGLYMTKMYVEKLGGSLVLKSEVGLGSTFTIKLKNHIIPSE